MYIYIYIYICIYVYIYIYIYVCNVPCLDFSSQDVNHVFVIYICSYVTRYSSNMSNTNR